MSTAQRGLPYRLASRERLKARLLTTLSAMSRANGIAVPVTVAPAVDGLRTWFLLIKEAQSIGSDG